MSFLKTLFYNKKDEEIKALQKSVRQLKSRNTVLECELKELSSLVKRSVENNNKRFEELKNAIPTQESVEDFVNDLSVIRDLQDVQRDVERIDWGVLDSLSDYDFDDFVTMDTLEDELDNMVTQDSLNEALEDFGNEFEGRIGDRLQEDIIQSRVEYELEAQVNSLDFEKIFKDECPALVNTVIAQMCVKLSSTTTK
jgi:hypothetical protein